MDMADTIWTALGILMVVCVCVDSGWTVFSQVQVVGLVQMFCYIACPNWSMWSVIFLMNIPIEAIGIFFSKRYPLARLLMTIHIAMKFMVLVHLTEENYVFWATHYLNQGIIVVLLLSSIRSFFTIRSSHAKQASRTGRSTSKTATPSPQRQLAFVRGLY